jgi:hypothetical protein
VEIKAVVETAIYVDDFDAAGNGFSRRLAESSVPIVSLPAIVIAA